MTLSLNFEIVGTKRDQLDNVSFLSDHFENNTFMRDQIEKLSSMRDQNKILIS